MSCLKAFRRSDVETIRMLHTDHNFTSLTYQIVVLPELTSTMLCGRAIHLSLKPMFLKICNVKIIYAGNECTSLWDH